jgi:glycosyltransferase involved in cell wall biosynthesis
MASLLRVGLDMRMERASGIGTYVRALSEQLTTHPDVELIPLRSHARPYSIREQLTMPRHTLGVDLVHCPQYNVPLASPRPLVVTIHDLAHLALPYYRRLDMRLYANVMLRAAAARASLVITDSAFTRGELVDRIGLDPARIRVIPCGVSPDFCPDPDPDASERLVREAGVHAPFVLHVGVVKPHKNLATLVEAFGRLGDRPEHLVLAGRREDLRVAEDDLDAAVARSPASARIHVLGEVPFPTLLALYRRARVLAMPSVYEGFGLPVLEAMACGTAVVCSDSASLPEVAGDAALLVAARDPGALAVALQGVLDDDDRRASLVERGAAQASHFTWARAAALHVEAYREVLLRR